MSKKSHAKKDNCKAPKDDESVLPLIKKKYMRVIILLLIVAVFLSSFITGQELIIAYVFIAILLGACYTMYDNMYCFQKVGFKYRPFVMTRYFWYVAIAGVVALLIYTVPLAWITGERVPYGVLRVLAALVPRQFYSMFTTAATYKKKDPTKCEFC